TRDVLVEEAAVEHHAQFAVGVIADVHAAGAVEDHAREARLDVVFVDRHEIRQTLHGTGGFAAANRYAHDGALLAQQHAVTGARQIAGAQAAGWPGADDDDVVGGGDGCGDGCGGHTAPSDPS